MNYQYTTKRAGSIHLILALLVFWPVAASATPIETLRNTIFNLLRFFPDPQQGQTYQLPTSYEDRLDAKLSSTEPDPIRGAAVATVPVGAFSRFKATEIKRRRRLGLTTSVSDRALLAAFASHLGFRRATLLDQKTGSSISLTGRFINQAKIQRAKRQRLLRNAMQNFRVQSFAVTEPNDFFCMLGLCWGFENGTGFLGQFIASGDFDIDAYRAWEITTGHPDEVVAVIDTGANLSHPDLQNQIFVNRGEIPNNGVDDDKNGFVDDLAGWNFIGNNSNPHDGLGHGSHVAGVIAAEQNNERGIYGVAPSSRILPLKVLDDEGAGDIAAFIAAVEYVIALKKSGINVRVMNASLGGPAMDTVVLREVLNKANAEGILLVAAAGNSSTDNDAEPVYPASIKLPNIISVGSIAPDGTLSGFSNYGASSVHIAAPGTFIWSSVAEGWYVPFEGTSMAAPFVAGIAALVYSKEPELTPSEVRDRIINTAKPISSLSGKFVMPGIPSAYYALINQPGPAL